MNVTYYIFKCILFLGLNVTAQKNPEIHLFKPFTTSFNNLIQAL